MAPCFAGMKPADGCDIFIPGTVPQQQLGGTDRVLAPEVSGFAGLDYERPLDNGLTVGATINLQFKDDYSFSEFGHPNANQKGYELLDAGLRIGDQDGRWSLALIGKNITEESINMGHVFRASRYGKGDADYINCPLNSSQYKLFIEAIQNAINLKPKGHDFDYSRGSVSGKMMRHMSHTGG